jgi:hypothetical protein
MTPEPAHGGRPRIEPEEPTPEPPVLADEEFPPYVETDQQELRFRRCVGIARVLFEGDGEANIWQAARALYHDASIPD